MEVSWHGYTCSDGDGWVGGHGYRAGSCRGAVASLWDAEHAALSPAELMDAVSRVERLQRRLFGVSVVLAGEVERQHLEPPRV